MTNKMLQVGSTFYYLTIKKNHRKIGGRHSDNLATRKQCKNRNPNCLNILTIYKYVLDLSFEIERVNFRILSTL